MSKRTMYSESGAVSQTVKIQVSPTGSPPARPVKTDNPPYEKIKHLLSDKPLRRPSRTTFIHQTRKTG